MRREAVQLLGNPWELAMVSWVPLLGCALLWWIFSVGLPTRLPIGVMDGDHSVLSRQLTRFLDATPGLQVVGHYSDTVHAERALRRTDVYAIVAIPENFSRNIKLGRAADVTLLHNAQLGTHSGLIQRDVRTAVGTLSAGIEMAARNKRGEPALGVQVSMEPVHTGAVPLFNVSLDYERFLAVQLFPALLHILAMTAGAWAVGTHLRDRTLVDWLGTAPTRLDAVVAVTAKLAWPLVSLGLVGTLALLGITWARGWEPAGSVAWTVAALWVFLTLSIVMGALASAALRSLRMGLSATGFVTAPAFAFSGVGFPLLAMPEGARLWAKALPFTHFARVQTEQLLMGAPLRVSLATPLWMGIATALFFGALVWSLRSIAAQPQSWGKR